MEGEALEINYRATNGLLLAFETAKMMTKVMEEHAEDDNWSSNQFTKILAQIQANEKPDDTMVELELDDDLRRFGYFKRKDLKLLIAKMSALQMKCGITILAKKKISCHTLWWIK